MINCCNILDFIIINYYNLLVISRYNRTKYNNIIKTICIGVYVLYILYSDFTYYGTKFKLLNTAQNLQKNIKIIKVLSFLYTYSRIFITHFDYR